MSKNLLTGELFSHKHHPSWLNTDLSHYFTHKSNYCSFTKRKTTWNNFKKMVCRTQEAETKCNNKQFEQHKEYLYAYLLNITFQTIKTLLTKQQTQLVYCTEDPRLILTTDRLILLGGYNNFSVCRQFTQGFDTSLSKLTWLKVEHSSTHIYSNQYEMTQTTILNCIGGDIGKRKAMMGAIKWRASVAETACTCASFGSFNLLIFVFR